MRRTPGSPEPLHPPAPGPDRGRPRPIDNRPADPAEDDAEPWDIEEDLDESVFGLNVPDDEAAAWVDDDSGPHLEDLPTLETVDDVPLDQPLIPDDPPLDDDTDAFASLPEDVPVIDPAPPVRIDDRAVPARIDLDASHTVWVGAPFSGARPTTLAISASAGVVRWTGAVVGRPGDPGEREELRLGRDVLVGRFLLRP